MAEGGGLKWLGFTPASRWGGFYFGLGGPALARPDVAGVPGHPISVTYLGGCQSARVIEAHLGCLSELKKRDRPIHPDV